jgi:hypothetical protein
MNREGKRSDELTGEESSSESKVDATGVPESSRPKRPPNLGVRKDKQHLHAMRHGILSQYPLQALALLGENTRRLRQMERALRTELKISGILLNILFDRMWSCFLRCLLAARVEGISLFPTKGTEHAPAQTPNLVEGEIPLLVWGTNENANGNVPPDLFQQLSLVQRYDAHYSREMLRYLDLLLLIRNRGEVGLEGCSEKMLVPKSDI